MHPIKHFITITKHRHKVMCYCFKMGIGWQGIFHDLSKYSFVEFWNGAKYYTGRCSPHDIERQEKGCSYAWMHHKGRNKHHSEYWIDVVNGRCAPVPIPIRYLKESLCDRIAASRIYLKKKYTNHASLNYYIDNHHAVDLHASSAKVLESWLRLVAEEGEKKAIQKIRKIKTYEEALG